MLYSQSLRDYARAQADLQNYLLKAPDGDVGRRAPASSSTQVTTALEAPSTTVPPTTTTRKKK